MLKNKKYVPLHVHSEYSNITLIDSINKIPEMVDYAIENGLPGMALTDHETIAGTVEYIKYYKSLPEDVKSGFKPIIGDEIYLVDDIYQEKMHHFLLLAKDREGYELLKRISSQAWENSYSPAPGFTRRPITKDQLADIIGENKGHLVATTACLAGEFPTLVNRLVALENMPAQDPEEIQDVKNQIINFMVYGMELFGKENFFIEVQPSEQRDQVIFNSQAKKFSEVFGVDIVITTDAHFLKKEDRPVHTAFLSSKRETQDSAQFYRSAYMMMPEEMYRHTSIRRNFTREELSHMLDNTIKIADMCEVYDVYKSQEIPYVDRSDQLEILMNKHPVFKVDFSKYEHLDRILREKDNTNLFWLYKIYDFLEKKDMLGHVYIDRINTEAGELYAISERLGENLFSYYVTMTKILEIAWEDANAIVGVGRGSVAGFFSAYALGIQGVDSIKYDLPHWRHISKERPELPDIDFDTPPSRRTNLILATKNFFGFDRVLNIATFKREGSKSALQTACRGYRSDDHPYGISSDEAAYLSSLIKYERGFAWTISETYYGDEEKEREPSRVFRQQIDKYPGLLEIALKIEGLISGRSSHASGVYIYNDHYTKYNAMMKAPNGLPTTQFDMDHSDYQGGQKFDYLTVAGMDLLQTTLELLIEAGYVEEKDTWRETYESVIGPDVLVDGDHMWQHAYNREMLSLFQFDTMVGGDAISKIKPHSLEEAAHVNSLMRLMPADGGEAPADKFVRFKNNPSLWYEEMTREGLNKEEQDIMREYLEDVYGVAATQEELMMISMDSRISGFGLTEANKLRKAVAKKNPVIMEEVRDEFFAGCRKNGASDNLANYVWTYVAMPQAGYSFSKLHTTAYTMIALQELTLYHNYPSVFWNTAVLTVNSGSVEEVINEDFVPKKFDKNGNPIEPRRKNYTVEYGKIAKAIGEIKSTGTVVAPPHINTASDQFVPDVENDRILFSLRGLSGVGDREIEKIMNNRPFKSFEDFRERSDVWTPGTVSLIKAGAFDELEGRPREDIMRDFIWEISSPKKRINLQNFKGMLDRDMIPKELDFERRLWNFNRYIRQSHFKRGSRLFLDSEGQRFMSEEYPDFFAEAELEDQNMVSVDEKEWKKIYDSDMDRVRDWMKSNQDHLLDLYNQSQFNEQWEKYAAGSIEKWEMDSMSYYSEGHELANVDLQRYGIASFDFLPEEPEIDYIFEVDGKSIPLYKIDKIIGTCIDKNNMANTFTLLTPDGSVVDIRLNNEHYALYNKQISEDVGGGKKEVREGSWFTRGEKLMVVGFRRNHSFVPKRYARTPEQHRLYRITDINDETGEILFTSKRWGQE